MFAKAVLQSIILCFFRGLLASHVFIHLHHGHSLLASRFCEHSIGSHNHESDLDQREAIRPGRRYLHAQRQFGKRRTHYSSLVSHVANECFAQPQTVVSSNSIACNGPPVTGFRSSSTVIPVTAGTTVTGAWLHELTSTGPDGEADNKVIASSHKVSSVEVIAAVFADWVQGSRSCIYEESQQRCRCCAVSGSRCGLVQSGC